MICLKEIKFCQTNLSCQLHLQNIEQCKKYLTFPKSL